MHREKQVKYAGNRKTTPVLIFKRREYCFIKGLKKDL